MSAAKLPPQDEAEIVEEVAQHLEAQFAELTPKIGESEARQRLLGQLREQGFEDTAIRRRRTAGTRSPRVWSSTSVLRDVRYGFRSLSRSPGVVTAGVAALALGIGLTTVMFSVIYGLLIKGLPFHAPERIAMIYRADPTGQGQEDLIPFADFVRYRAEQRSFVAFGAYEQATVNVSGGDRPDRLSAARFTAGAFDVTGVRALIGRTLRPADESPASPPIAVIGYAMWRDRFSRDSSVINKAVRVNGQAYTIVGVMPEGFAFPRSQQMWLPLQRDTSGLRAGEGRPVTLVARLRDGVGYDRANAELSTIARRLAQEPADSAAIRDYAQPYIRATMPARVYSLLYAMLGAVFMVLLVACANVANLLLDRAANRTREIGIRVALGASRIAVVRQSLVESGILALLAAVVGTGLAEIGIVAFNRAMVALEAERPFWLDVRLHVPVLLFVLAIAVVASIVSGLLPAIHSARLDINTILKDESHAASSLRVGRVSRAIVVAEIALSTAMLLAAGFMTKSITLIRKVEPRFSAGNVFTARATLASSDTVRQAQFFEALERGLGAVPGIEGVYLGNDFPGTGWRGDRLAIEGQVYARERDYPTTRWLAVSPGFFSTFTVPLLRGRPIMASDRTGTTPVAIVNEAFVRRHFANVDPLGRRIRIGDPKKEKWLTIVGVIPTLYALGMVAVSGNHYPPEVLTAYWQQRPTASASIALRGPAAIANATTVRKVVAALDPDVPVYAAAAMDDVLYQPTWPLRLFGTMFVIFGIVSLVLAAIGLYAVMAFSVSRRTREMGIRMALGASAGNVVRLICRQGATQIVIGMGIGLLVGAGLVRMVSMLLFEVRPGDLSVFGIVASVLGVAAFVACIIPAFRATRVDPLVALRSE
ncbi:MAG TPA: ABC transporter permease [Gemmatimonadaceae bacterium]|nr:ABC transporter permease [Gemmatimonadaceae bacterium]